MKRWPDLVPPQKLPDFAPYMRGEAATSIPPVHFNTCRPLTRRTGAASLASGGDFGIVDLIYIPEPSSLLLALIGIVEPAALAAVTTFGHTRSAGPRAPEQVC